MMKYETRDLCTCGEWDETGVMGIHQDELLNDLEGNACRLGLSMPDRATASLAMWFPDDHGPTAACVTLMSEEFIAKRDPHFRGAGRDAFHRDTLVTVPGDRVTPWAIVNQIELASWRFHVSELRLDRWRWKDLAAEFDRRDLDIPVREFGQGFRDFSPAIDQFERHLRAPPPHRITRGTNRLLSDAVGFTQCVFDPMNGNRKPKAASHLCNIDPAVALLMALAEFPEKGEERVEAVFKCRRGTEERDHE